MPSKYVFKTTPAFGKVLRKLTPRQKASAQDAFRIFKHDPFDPRLRTHKIHGLSAKLGRTIYSVYGESDLRVVFYLTGDLLLSLDIEDHAIYRT